MGTEAIRGASGHRGVSEAGRKCRYSGARRGIGGIRGHWVAPRVCKGPLGHQGV